MIDSELRAVFSISSSESLIVSAGKTDVDLAFVLLLLAPSRHVEDAKRATVEEGERWKKPRLLKPFATPNEKQKVEATSAIDRAGKFM